MSHTSTSRIEAIDIFRALTMFLMLFVNDIPSLTNIPHGLHHAAFDEDMLGFSDTIFPAFLFIMGMSVPFALELRIKKGNSFFQCITHIFWRTVALLAMGVYTVNRDMINPVATGMSNPIFSILMVIGFFLIWGVYPRAYDWKRLVFGFMQLLGLALLGWLFYIYKGIGGASFTPQWWGILGLIGWTYAVCTVIYLVTRNNLLYNGIAFAGLIIFTCFVPGGSTLHAFGMAGVVASLLMQRYAQANFKRFTCIMVSIGLFMLATGWIAHHYWIVSKIQATPTWLFYCCALFFPLFTFFYWLIDIKGKNNWFVFFKPAGIATLTCYIIPYVWYSAESLLQVHYPAFILNGIVGLVKSIIYALGVVGVTWLLLKGGIKLKV